MISGMMPRKKTKKYEKYKGLPGWEDIVWRDSIPPHTSEGISNAYL
jgi:hypothetical protein